MMDPQQVNDIFGFHPATPVTGPLHDVVRSQFKELAQWINGHVPDSREKSLAITHLQTAMMFSNAAVAIHTPSE